MIHTWDLNGGGHLDLVMPSGHGHSEKENTTIYLNLDGEIDGRSRLEIPGNHSRGGFIADLDKDGFNDLVVANYSDSQHYQVGAWIYLGSAEGYASNATRLSRLSMRTMLAPAGVMPMKSDAFAKKRVRPSEAHSTAFHSLGDVVASSSVPKGD